MGWRDLLQAEEETLVAPWVGGRSLRTFDRTWHIEGRMPPEYGWYSFKLAARKARRVGPAEAPFGVLKGTVRGYLVGDRLIPEGTARVEPQLAKLVENFERVYLVEPGLDRFVRVAAGRFHEDGPLIYENQEFPSGPEQEVVTAFLDEAKSIDDIVGVVPALDLAFRVESWRRAEAERLRREEQERREREERQRRLREQMGTGAGRRELARENFGEAAKAALTVGGAEYVDHRQAPNRNEMIVRFRVDRRRFECVCSKHTLQIIDAGICLTAHYDDPNFAGGTRGDTLLTLESLPCTIRQAVDEGRLVVFRHVN
jgi:hypothetical protein